MEMNKGKLNEKLLELLELAKKKKNVMEYTEISDFCKDKPLNLERMEKIFSFSREPQCRYSAYHWKQRRRHDPDDDEDIRPR